MFVVFKGSSNKRIKYNQDENEQDSELKSKNIGNYYSSSAL